MMLLTVRELMIQKGIKPSIKRLTHSGIGYSAAKQYLNGTAKSIKLDDIEKLCYYFTCTPRELMCMTNEPRPVAPGHPLQGWVNDYTPSPIQDLWALKPEQLKKAHEMLRKIMDGEV